MRALPTGTVTFLFTDIEGSTKLWEEQTQIMQGALARHDALMRAAIEANEGIVFKTIGDAYCAAFSTAPQALAAALAAQLSLQSVKAEGEKVEGEKAEGEKAEGEEAENNGLKLKVRMALHTGTAEQREGDYFGQPLNRAARLLAIGHGGQVLLTDVVQELVRDTLSPTAALRSLGEHRLRDMGRPEYIFQLLHSDLASEFAPLKSLDNLELPNNLPRQVTSFIGRDKEIEDVKSLLGRKRLLTLTGSGGCGKTRLALQVAAEVLEQFPQGVWLVELAALSDPDLVTQVVGNVLGVREEAGKPILQTLLTSLKDRKMLLVLDNCEHLLSACAPLCDALLRACADVRVIASSREGLGIAGETVYRIPSLSMPDLKHTETIASVGLYDSVRLFIDRATAVSSDFMVTSANAPALASVCHRLDGIPLAIELAGARVRSLSVEEIDSKLDNRFRLLTGGSKTSLPRQQTLRALIDWSYTLLSEQEQTLLCRISVFTGGWTLEAVEQVCSGYDLDTLDVLDLLMALVDKSLVSYDDQRGQSRYRLLETVRQYASERLLESAEGQTFRSRHRDYFVTLAQDIQPELSGSDQARGLEQLETEHDNLRQAFKMCEEDSDGVSMGLRLLAAMSSFWIARDYLSEGRVRCQTFLEREENTEPTPERATALISAGNLAYCQGDLKGAKAHFEAALGVRERLGDRHGSAGALGSLGNVAHLQGEYTRARGLFEQALAISRELDIPAWEGVSLGCLGNLSSDMGDYAAARVYLEAALALNRRLGNRGHEAISLNSLGGVAREEAKLTEALLYYEQGLAITLEVGIVHQERDIRFNMAGIRGRLGETSAACALFCQSLEMQHEGADTRSLATKLEDIATFFVAQNYANAACRVWGAAAAIREEIGSPRPVREQDDFERETAAARLTLGDEAFATAWAQGRALTMAQALTYAIEQTGNIGALISSPTDVQLQETGKPQG